MAKETNKKKGASNNAWGALAESIAAEYYIKQGYTIRARNHKVNNMEIDLIVELGNTIAFVEVKARSGKDQDPVDAVDRKKRLRMVRAADVYLRNEKFDYQYRFDIITLTGTPESYTFEPYLDAFLPPLSSR